MDDLSKSIGELASHATLTEMPASAGDIFTGEQAFDYSHLLDPEHKKAGYRLYVDHSDFGQLSAHLLHPQGYAGGVDGKMDGTDLHVDGAQIMPLHRGQGLGTPLYEALVSHARKKFNAARWVGGDHSTAAHKLHARLTAKHGFTYEGGEPNPAVAGNPTGDFDKKFGNYAIHLKSEIEAAEEALAKVLPTPTFPKLGMPDDRRETKLIQTPTQEKVMQGNKGGGVLGNLLPKKMNSGKKITQKLRTEVGKEVYNEKAVGGSFISPKGTAVSYAKPTASNPRVTMLHEDTHRMFTRIEQQYGQEARKNLATNIIQAMPGIFQKHVRAHGAFMNGAPDDEEAISYVVSYVNNPEHRNMYHAKKNFNEKQALAYGSMMKRAYKHIQGISGVVNQNWLGRTPPWIQNA